MISFAPRTCLVVTWLAATLPVIQGRRMEQVLGEDAQSLSDDHQTNNATTACGEVPNCWTWTRMWNDGKTIHPTQFTVQGELLSDSYPNQGTCKAHIVKDVPVNDDEGPHGVS